jgi:hypothetical protein
VPALRIEAYVAPLDSGFMSRAGTGPGGRIAHASALPRRAVQVINLFSLLARHARYGVKDFRRRGPYGQSFDNLVYNIFSTLPSFGYRSDNAMD